MSEVIFVRRMLNRLGRSFGSNPLSRASPKPFTDGYVFPTAVFDETQCVNFLLCRDSGSGLCSELVVTATCRKSLARFLVSQRVKSLFDAQCDDLNWMSTYLFEHPAAFEGVDIFAGDITQARAHHAEPDLRERAVIGDPCPKAGISLCRNFLFQLPFSARRHFLVRLTGAGIRPARITSRLSRNLQRYLGVSFGELRLLYKEKAPFGQPTYLARIPDYSRGQDFPLFVRLCAKAQVARAGSEWRNE